MRYTIYSYHKVKTTKGIIKEDVTHSIVQARAICKLKAGARRCMNLDEFARRFPKLFATHKPIYVAKRKNYIAWVVDADNVENNTKESK
jgi:hypothetical protein